MNRHATEVRVPCLYRRTWQDGFGARGWKLASTANDPEVIASTAATGECIPTSVFVHDILDHLLCGLGPSGHRNEAVALLQLAARTGGDPTPDFAQMVDEDLLQGRVLGETFHQFLPPELTTTLPAGIRDGKAIVERLQEQLGPEVLRKRLIARFFELGRAGTSKAREHYASHGLDFRRRGPLGLALQRLLERADGRVRETNLERASGEIWITPRHCGFEIREPRRWSREAAYRLDAAVPFVQTSGPGITVNVSYSTRTFILGADDTLYRLASAKFSRMVDDPASHRMVRFAGQRVRMAEAIVEVHDRAPVAVVRLIFEMLGFDAEGRLDRAAFIRQNAALAELAMSPVIRRLEAEETAVVDAGSRFVARGGSWQPTPKQEREILSAALDETPCKRL